MIKEFCYKGKQRNGLVVAGGSGVRSYKMDFRNGP